MPLGLLNRKFTVMKNTCCQYGVGTAGLNPVGKMVKITHAP